jgi:hypothetical protein
MRETAAAVRNMVFMVVYSFVEQRQTERVPF